ncbi:LOW QUALITY PROTEIN: uncharacterized protein Dwil_GK13226 [Drosophila willistoni]|uniref:Uncharacterized protein n=1 Tax=Drosophila willistoni TaxID=7260 RepID=B4N3S1_DROWI|nr:LOW QUALITY PROTEIN: uncharacterized protein Dwil_GK13226 [Drosophila willistoni]
MASSLTGLLFLALCTLTYSQWPPQSSVPIAGGPLPSLGVGLVTPAPLPTLLQDLEEIIRLIQFKPIKQLVLRYLLNDAEFQAFVRIINSQSGFTARWRLLSQPELIQFLQWVDQQLVASGGGSFEFEENELGISLWNRYPYWSGSVLGWRGFLSELQLYFPQYAIRGLIEAKVLQRGIFSQFWTRMQALQGVYERWLTWPDTISVLDQLHAAGIDKNQLDGIIRELFGWSPSVATTNGTTTAATPAAPTQSPAAVLPPANHPLGI